MANPPLPQFDTGNPTLTDDQIAKMLQKAQQQIGLQNNPQYLAWLQQGQSGSLQANQQKGDINLNYDEAFQNMSRAFKKSQDLVPGNMNDRGIFGSGVMLKALTDLSSDFNVGIGQSERRRANELGDVGENLALLLSQLEERRAGLKGSEGLSAQMILDSMKESALAKMTDNQRYQNSLKQDQFSNQMSLASFNRGSGGGGGRGGSSGQMSTRDLSDILANANSMYQTGMDQGLYNVDQYAKPYLENLGIDPYDALPYPKQQQKSEVKGHIGVNYQPK